MLLPQFVHSVRRGAVNFMLIVRRHRLRALDVLYFGTAIGLLSKHSTAPYYRDTAIQSSILIAS